MIHGKKTLMLLKICCVGFSLKFKSYFSNIDIVLLNENLKELKRKKRNEKARLRRREQK